MLHLKNLSSTEVFDGAPWDTPVTVPDVCRENKALRTAWITDPKTSHIVYSTWEGVSEKVRVKRKGMMKVVKPKASGGEEEDTKFEAMREEASAENQPYKCHGVVADFDMKLSSDEVASGFEKMAPFIPTYYGRSCSGNAHLVWVFEKPIVINGWDLAEAFLKLVMDKLHIRSALPGLDMPAFADPCKYYTSGGEWFQINPSTITYETALGWLVQASKKLNWREQGYCVPLSAVKTDLLEHSKPFADQWADVDFQLDSQGPTWWVEGSTSPKSAIVKESGMFTFSAHATKNFYTWAELTSPGFVDQYRTQKAGDSVKGIYYDGHHFWREITRGDWKCFGKDDILHFLRVTRGVSDKVTKGDPISELDAAYEFIIDHHNIEGAAPFVFRDNGPLQINNKPFLNTHTARVVRPIDYTVEWGHGFPWLAKFLGTPGTVDKDPNLPRIFKGGHVALDTFISWLAHFYKSAYEMRLVSGHNIFICGPQNIGKTFMNREIIGGLLNGYREAKEYLMGEDTFGAELFGVAHWVVDDGTMSNSVASHRRWGEMIKRMAANKTFRYHAKFRSPLQVEWQGRVVITLNNDEESSRLLPDIERSILDKIELYQTVDSPTVDFLPSDEMKSLIENELPYLAKFLLQWETPEYCVARRSNGHIDYRFGGIKPWHDEKMIKNANQTSRTSGFYEILLDWKREHFRLVNENKPKSERVTSWEGTAFELHKSLCSSPATQSILKGVDNADISRSLSQLKSKGHNIENRDDGEVRYWKLYE